MKQTIIRHLSAAATLLAVAGGLTLADTAIKSAEADAPAEFVEPAPVEWEPVYTFDEAIAQCETYLTGQELSDCIGNAQISWCEFVPFPEDSPHYREDIDGPCLAWEQEQEQIALDMAELEEPEILAPVEPEPLPEPEPADPATCQ